VIGQTGTFYAGTPNGGVRIWAYTNTILDFSRRGKPTGNAALESFNGGLREACVNVHWFQP
jgi:hypothetical protein